ncbi:MAG: sigma 54-interacting transcriptional regulator [Desulfobulbaceae bacterium]|nr:sigma 54-interacting transcriptional regulator [Desulfobulbaceae bacterium]
MTVQAKTFESPDNGIGVMTGSGLINNIDLIQFMDQFPHGLLLFDTSLQIVIFNQYLEVLTGYKREDVIGVRGDAVLRSNLNQHEDPLHDVFETEEKVVIEGDMINRDRKKIQVRFTVAPLRSNSGDVTGAVVFVEDISLLKDLDEKAHGSPALNKIIGHSRKMQEVFDMLPVVAKTDASILITGETGTGKDYIAEAIHKASRRAKHPFIKVNCAALPESLLESELFGHVRGAFTGADRDKPGMFNLADKGTIFLTEIGDLPLSLQIKLLTALDDREFYPVGGSKKVRVNVRIIAATHRDLETYVKQGMFREDLFYRLNVLRLPLPPLRERDDDVRLLLEHFLREFSSELKKNIKGIDPAALAVLSSYDYPGNVRELRNIAEYAANLCDGSTIRLEHLPQSLTLEEKKDREAALSNSQISSPLPDKSTVRSSEELVGAPATAGWSEIEKRMILDALLKTGGRKTEAAGLLGWSRTKLWRKIKTYGMS